jgi:hypothetical protein
MITGGRYLLLTPKDWVSGVCRSLPPAMRFSVSLMEKTDAQIQFLSGGKVPEGDTGELFTRGNPTANNGHYPPNLNLTDIYWLLTYTFGRDK